MHSVLASDQSDILDLSLSLGKILYNHEPWIYLYWCCLKKHGRNFSLARPMITRLTHRDRYFRQAHTPLGLGKYCLFKKDKGLIVYIWSKEYISTIFRSCAINVYFTCLSTKHDDTDFVNYAVWWHTFILVNDKIIIHVHFVNKIIYCIVLSIFSVVSFRKANRLGVIFKVTPQAQDGDVKVNID
jgi:hypothetical protein